MCLNIIWIYGMWWFFNPSKHSRFYFSPLHLCSTIFFVTFTRRGNCIKRKKILFSFGFRTKKKFIYFSSHAPLTVSFIVTCFLLILISSSCCRRDHLTFYIFKHFRHFSLFLYFFPFLCHLYIHKHTSDGSKNRHHRNALCDVLLIYGEIFFILFIVMSRFGKSKKNLWQTSISHKIYSPVLTQQLDFMILWSNIRTSFNRSNAVCTSVCRCASFGSKYDKKKFQNFISSYGYAS